MENKVINNKKVYIVLDNIKYAKNIGAIIRIADAFCLEKVFICKANTQKLNDCQKQILHKTSRGVSKFVNWEFRNSCIETIKELKAHNIAIASIEIDKYSIPLYDFKPIFPLALVFGSEKEGISSGVMNISDYILSIPMNGRGKSLNVSTTASIVVYDVLNKN